MSKLNELADRYQICAVIGHPASSRSSVLSKLSAGLIAGERTALVCGSLTHMPPSTLVDLFLSDRDAGARGILEGEAITPSFFALWAASELSRMLILLPGANIEQVAMLYPQHKVAIKGMSVAQQCVSDPFFDVIMVSDQSVCFNRIHQADLG